MDKFEWSCSYPKHCPPSASYEREITEVYRFIKGAHLSEKEFYPNNQTSTQINLNNCGMWAVSFFDSIDNLENCRAKVSAFRDRKYAIGAIKKNYGLITHGEDGHINLWRYRNVIIYTTFRMV